MNPSKPKAKTPSKVPLLPCTADLAARFKLSTNQIRRLGRRIGIEYARGAGQEHRYTAVEITRIKSLIDQGGLRVLAAQARKKTQKAPAKTPKAPAPKASTSKGLIGAKKPRPRAVSAPASVSVSV